MNTQTFYRKANVSRAKATAQIFSKFPTADLVSFEQKEASASEAAACGAKVGEPVYAATIRVAEFPPSDDSSGDDSSDSEEKAPAPSKEKSEDSSDDSSNDDSSDDSGAPDFGGGDDDGGKPEKLSGEDLTNHLLQQILDALKGGGGPGPGAPGDGGDLGLPDVGAPGQGDSLPAPGGPPTKAPLPPPVPPKSPMGGGAFSHYDASQSQIFVVRKGANETNNAGLIAEASEVYPTHSVAKIQRTGSVNIDGQAVDLAANKIAVVTLVQK